MAEAPLQRWRLANPRRRVLAAIVAYFALIGFVLLWAHQATKWRAHGFLMCLEGENSTDRDKWVHSPIFLNLAARSLNDGPAQGDREISADWLRDHVRFSTNYPYTEMIYESHKHRDAQRVINALVEAYVFVFPPDLPGNERREDTALLESLATCPEDREVLAVRRKFAAMSATEAQSDGFDSGPLVLGHFWRVEPTGLINWIGFSGACFGLAVFGLTVAIRTARQGSWRIARTVRFVTQRRAVYAMIGVTVVLAGLYTLGWATAERRYEFDTVNLRTRYCEANIFYEHCSDPAEHVIGQKLRELGILEPVTEAEARWELVKGFKKQVRGWIGCGREYVTVLGAHTLLTPVTLPVEEEVSANLWVRWALVDPDGAKQFWQEQRSLALSQPWLAAHRLRIANRFLETHDANVRYDAMNAEIRRLLETDGL